ncbi:MAG: hypothetical protein EOO14_00260 [Chitinophagaceae bacterium]|nr:MAG: hypothetical protein EOO14_00260 [Chitinophagaceae bacterium]
MESKPGYSLSLFYQAILLDSRIGITHISLYVALYQLWEWKGFQKPLRVKRSEVMELAKISSSATYHKCLRQLIEYGFITYYPCSDPARKSEVYFTIRDQPEKDTGSAGAQPVER